MSRLTREDLQKKTTPQLAALFNEVNCEIASLEAGTERDCRLRLRAMIRRELASRPNGP